MTQLTVQPSGALTGRIRVPGDKSISHRAVMFGALADGDSEIRGFLDSGDCRATLSVIRSLGIDIDRVDATTLVVRGRGLRGLRAPSRPLDCVRSGTTMRLMAGILAGQPFDTTLTGHDQLIRRPMRRITQPLREMGADIEDIDGHAPLSIHGERLHGHDHTLPVASAQVKSALLLAGLYADGETIVRQPGPARDHTERMLSAMGAEVEIAGLDVTLRPPRDLAPNSLTVPGDLSSAAFLLVAAAMIPGSKVTVEAVGVNPTRTGLLDVLLAMEADLSLDNRHTEGGEPMADVNVAAGPLKGVEVAGPTVVRMIDEFPILAVAATQAEGTTTVRDAAELRVKETDRIAVVVKALRKMGAQIEARPDGFVVEGPTPLHGALVESQGDHRVAMALTIAGLLADDETQVVEAECISDSFPGFVDRIRNLGAQDIR